MTNSGGSARASKNERRAAARDKARTLREEQKKKARRNKFILQGSLIVVTLAIVAVVAVVIYSTIRPPAPGPLNMLSDGIKIGQNFEAVTTPGLQPSEEPVPSSSNIPADVLDIRIYVDYLCPYCGGFEAANAQQIKKLVGEGAATLEIHPVAILDRNSLGTKYSTRAANAAACVSNFSPNNFYDFSALLFAHQPAEGTAGLSDDELIGYAKEAGVSKLTDITSCVNDQTFKNWVAGATSRFSTNPIPNVVSQPAQKSTPTIYVSGQQYIPQLDSTGNWDPQDFAAFLVKVLGTNFVESSTPSPSPSASPAP